MNTEKLYKELTVFCKNKGLEEREAAYLLGLFTNYAEALRQPLVSCSLQDRLFELANDFAVDKQGEVAVKLHGIHNGLQ